MKIKELIAPSEFDKKAKPMGKLPRWNDKQHLNIGAGTSVSAQTVVVKDTSSGKVIGRRSIYQK